MRWPFTVCLLFAALLNKGNRVLKVVMGIPGAVGSKDAAHRHRLAVYSFDDAKLVGADLNQRDLLHNAFDRVHDKVQARLQNVGLKTDLTVGRDDAALRHTAAEIPAFVDTHLFGTDIHEKSCNDIPKDQKAEYNAHGQKD